MSVRRPRLRPIVVNNGSRKKGDLDLFNNSTSGCLSPDLQPSPPVFPKSEEKYQINELSKHFKLGKYFLVDQLDGNEVYKAVDSQTKEEYVCKVFGIEKYKNIRSPYWQVDCHEHVSSINEIILGETKAYVFFDRHYGDLHSYVRQKKRLRESVVCSFLRQMVSAVKHCHDNGIVLRDLKLRKFVFKDPARTQLRLDGLEDAIVLDDELDDKLLDRHGCPAYVSPEILDSETGYSGRAADIWSLGVMVYTMLVGRYPFHDTEPNSLFNKIRNVLFNVPDVVSPKAKCLIKNLIKKEASERLTAHEILFHPWFNETKNHFHSRVDQRHQDQIVPEFTIASNANDDFFV